MFVNKVVITEQKTGTSLVLTSRKFNNESTNYPTNLTYFSANSSTLSR